MSASASSVPRLQNEQQSAATAASASAAASALQVHLQNKQQLNEHDTAADAAAGSCGNQTNSPNGYSKLLERSMPRCRVSHSVNSN